MCLGCDMHLDLWTTSTTVGQEGLVGKDVGHLVSWASGRHSKMSGIRSDT